jgi:DNA-binding MarR family transcriptional regulator
MPETYGFELAFKLAGSFRRLIDELHDDLASNGFRDTRPVHGFALQAIGPAGINTTNLALRLGVTKQAASKTVSSLLALGYVSRSVDPDDARAQILRRSESGERLLALSARFFEEKQKQWIRELGDTRYFAFVADLDYFAGDASIGDLPGWIE